MYSFNPHQIKNVLDKGSTSITKYQYINRCITRLEARDTEIINQFTRKNLTFAKGAELLHMVRSTIYKMQRRAVTRLTEIYNA